MYLIGNIFNQWVSMRTNGACVLREAVQFIFECSDGSKARPADIYLDEPFMKTGLAIYFNLLGDNIAIKPLSQIYAESPIDINKVTQFSKSLGAIYELPIKKVSCWQNPDREYLTSMPGGYGYGENTDYDITGLKDLLESPTVELAKLVWTRMNLLDETYLKATYQKSEKGGPRNADSQLVHILKNASWIPQHDGKFVKPSDAFIDQLPAGFTYDGGMEWLKKIEFGKNTIKQTEKTMYAREFGFESPYEAEKAAEIARICRDAGKPLDEILSQLSKTKKETKPKFPSKKSPNPEQRADKVSQHHADAPEKTYEDKIRSVRTSATSVDKDSYLRDKYTNEDDELVCQICKDVMPFKKRNGEYYFEAVETLSKNHFSKEYGAHYLALCPVCAAKYKEFIKKDESTMNTLKSDLINSDSNHPEIPLLIDKTASSIQFHEDHLIDIRTILQIETEN